MCFSAGLGENYQDDTTYQDSGEGLVWIAMTMITIVETISGPDQGSFGP